MSRLFFNAHSSILILLLGLLVPNLGDAARHRGHDIPRPTNETIIAQIDFRDVSVGDALKVLTEQSSLNVVASKKAADIPITIFLRQVTAMDVIDAIAKTYNLWYQRDPETDIVRIYTVQEYRLETVEFKKEETEVFTMKNARNVLDLADSIQNLFSTRVRMGYGNNQTQLMMDLQQRFQRFDMVDRRSKVNTTVGGSTTGGTGGTQGGTNTGGVNTGGVGVGGTTQGGVGTQGINGIQGTQGINGMQGINAQQGMNGVQGNGGQNQGFDDQTRAVSNVLDRLNGNQVTGIANSMTGDASESQELIDTSVRHEALIYVGVIKDQNRVVVRTRDIDAMNEIKSVAKQLDVESSMLLMEVKVLQIDLSNGFNSLFDFNVQKGDFNLGGLGGIAGGGAGAGSALANGAASAAFGPALLATVVSNNFEARLQLAENENRVTQLATPLLLTANQEISRFFVGSEIPILTSYTPGTTTLGGVTSSATIIQPPTPVYTQYRVGQTLLLTPSINADKTVSVQIVVEQSNVIKNGATILVPGTSSILGGAANLVPQQIDTVNEKSFSGSVMAKDGNSVAVGGLIQEGAGNNLITTPFLGDVPILGFFFRQESQTRTRTELVIIIKPHIIATPPDGKGLTEAFMRDNSIHPNATGGESLNVYTNPDKQHKGYILEQPFKEYNNQDSLDRYKWDNPNPRR